MREDVNESARGWLPVVEQARGEQNQRKSHDDLEIIRRYRKMRTTRRPSKTERETESKDTQNGDEHTQSEGE